MEPCINHSQTLLYSTPLTGNLSMTNGQTPKHRQRVKNLKCLSHAQQDRLTLTYHTLRASDTSAHIYSFRGVSLGCWYTLLVR